MAERHRHTAECWKYPGTYEPCGEHHAHDYNCGGGRLNPSCPEYERSLRSDLGFHFGKASESLRNAADLASRYGEHDLAKRIRDLAQEVRQVPPIRV